MKGGDTSPIIQSQQCSIATMVNYDCLWSLVVDLSIVWLLSQAAAPKFRNSFRESSRRELLHL